VHKIWIAFSNIFFQIYYYIFGLYHKTVSIKHPLCLININIVITALYLFFIELPRPSKCEKPFKTVKKCKERNCQYMKDPLSELSICKALWWQCLYLLDKGDALLRLSCDTTPGMLTTTNIVTNWVIIMA
jgi:hypothetical protein